MKEDLKKEVKYLKPIIKLAMKYKALQVSFYIKENMIDRVKKYFQYNNFQTSINKYNELVIILKNKAV